MVHLCRVDEWSSFWMVDHWGSENWTKVSIIWMVWPLCIQKPDKNVRYSHHHSKTEQFFVWCSDVAGIRVSGIRMVTLSTSGQRSQVSSCPDKAVPGVHLKEVAVSSGFCSEASPFFADSSSTGSDFPEESAVVAMSLTVILAASVWTTAFN